MRPRQFPPNTPPSKPMRPALLRRRAKRSYAFSNQHGTLSRQTDGRLTLRVNAHDIRYVEFAEAAAQLSELALPCKVKVKLWPRTDQQATVRWLIAQLALDTTRGSRQATYISGRYKALRRGGLLVVSVTPRQAAAFDLTLQLACDLPSRLTPGEVLVVHAHEQAQRLMAHHVFQLPSKL